MKILFSIFLLCGFNACFAQTHDSIKVKLNVGKNEIYTSYGFMSLSGLSLALGRIFSKDYPSSYFFRDNNEYTSTYKVIPPLLSALNFGYKRYVFKNKLCVTSNFIYSQINQNNISNINDTLSFKTKDKVFCIMPGIEYHYFYRKIVQMYVGAQVGLFIYNQKYIGFNNEIKKHNELFIAFQLDAFGIRVGKKIAGFMEIGFGNAGIVKLGISGRF